MLAFYKQMLYGLLRFTHMTRITVSNFGLFASVQDVMVYFKLKHRKLYLLFVSLKRRTYRSFSQPRNKKLNWKPSSGRSQENDML